MLASFPVALYTELTDFILWPQLVDNRGLPIGYGNVACYARMTLDAELENNSLPQGVSHPTQFEMRSFFNSLLILED